MASSTTTAISNQRLRKNGSPSVKQGPIKATKQFSLTTSPSRSLHRSSPNTSSPGPKDTVIIKPRNRPLSETCILGSSSPAISLKSSSAERLKSASSGSSSFENLMAPYLSGQWPKDPANISACSISTSAGIFTSDKQTQTPDNWEDISVERRRPKSQNLPYKRSHSVGSGDQFRNIKYKLQKNVGSYQNRLSPSTYTVASTNTNPVSSTQPIKIPSNASYSHYAAIPHGTPGKARGSVEGLNQEVEKLIICGRVAASDQDDDLVTEDVEGHRAPVVELLSRTTQTPIIETHLPDSLPNDPLPIMFEVSEINGTVDRSESCSPERSHSVSTTDESEGRCVSVSPSFIPGQFDLEERVADVVTSERKYHANRMIDNPTIQVTKAVTTSEFLREPPDGAEKVKVIDEKVSKPAENYFPLPTSSVRFQPSATSAFKYLPNQRLPATHS